MVPLTTRDGKSSRHAWRAGAGLVTATALVVTLAPAAPAAPVAASGPSSLTSSDWQAPEVPPPLEIESTPQLEADEIATVPLAARAPMPLAVPGPAVWPTPGQVPEPTEDPSGSGEWRSAEGVLMLRMSPPSVEPRPGAPVVTVLDRGEAEELGVEGLVMDVEPAAEQPDVTELQVDYSDFADAYGGDWSSRLRVVQLPDCARTTPELDECRTQTPLESTNDPGAQTVTAAITPQTQGLVALAAAPSASSGNWSATPLSASAAWQVSPQTGDFSWSYPMRVVPGLGGPQPELALAYSSGSLDGRVSSTNNQTSWIGDGWDLSTGYIERKYASCADDVENGATNANRTTGDLCWSTDNATMVFDGRATELVKDATTGTWRGKADDGTRIERLTGGFSADDDGEYWRVTTTDGVQYFFGRDKRSASDSLALNSAWTVPVFGNHAGEPCYSSSFASAHCTQTWRWNLDYVVDPSGNSMTYVYEKETNNYGRNLNTGVSSYVRGGYLTRIDYGTRAGAEPEKSPARVTFTVAERCLPSGGVTCAPSQLTSASSSHWPDVPFDLICTSTSSCPTQTSPSFFTRKRLTTVTTSALQESGAYQDVDVWTLTHQFPDPGDGLDPTLWLAGIGHTGRVGDSIALPDVTFHGMQMANRVDRIGDVAPPMNRYRIIAIDTEAGATLSVNYTAPDCSTSSLPSRPDNNSRRCFPVMWSPEGSPDPILEYFHKYLVTSVVADGRDGRSPATETHYSYLDAPAWRYDDNPIVPVKQRTWGDFRGYATVEVFSGSENDPVRSSTRLRFFRGMHGDKIAAGGTRSVSIDGIADVDHLNGFTRQEITYDGVGGAELSRTTSTPWLSSPTATGSDGETARFLGTGTSEARTVAPAAPGGALTTRTVTTFEGAYGLPTQVDDQGDVTLTTDDQCTRIEYVRNTSAHIVATVKRSETVAVTCSATPARPADVVADTRMAYDGKAVGAAPTRGLVTTTQRVADYSGSTPQYVTEATTTYDVHGRVLTATDALGRTATTAYSPATGGLLTSTTSTSPDPDGSGPLTAHATTTDVNPAWGTPTRVTDPNGKVTSAMLDALGRVTGVWLPGRSQGSQTANVTYGYTVSADGRNAVTTSTLGALGSRQTSVQLYDGLLRPTQTQTPSARRNEPGRVITDTVYDSRGLVMVANSAWFHSGSPSTAFVEPVAAVHARTRYEYDGAGRVTAEIFDLRDHEAWRTTTSYGGDRVSVDPPQGGTPQTTISDARGRLTELRQFTGAAPTGEYNATTYAYDKAGRLNQVTDAAGNSWTYTFDLRGRQVATTDPDRGASSSTYDDAGQVLTTTDARGITLAYTRDVLGRQTSLREGSATGTVRASWSYDTLAKGQLTSSTRHVGSAEYVTAVTGYDDGYRPLGQSVTVPDAEGELAGTYTTSYTYTLDGQLKTMRLPAAGGMDEETVTTTYDQLSLPRTLSGGLGWGTYVSDAGYSPYGEPLWMDLNNSSADIVTYSYEQGTRRLQNVAVQRENEPVRDMDVSYTYDQAGNPTSIVDEGRGPVDAQCFEYDGLRRLVQAWTPSSADCGVEPTAAGLGGPAPYWFEDSFDVVGNRVSRVVGGSEGSTSFAYAYPAAGGAGAHQVASVTRTGAQGAGSSSYVYDQAGNTVTREVA
ncbi:hypothetical protein GXB85_17685, partial [Cellulomonas sp. APG4]|uniref:SpvB/TcaC N-terminal domain-containing protein n=1 Tax=Cellulomonas sp. APG4 TaxID=1538656 RepID=UPI00137AB149